MKGSSNKNHNRGSDDHKRLYDYVREYVRGNGGFIGVGISIIISVCAFQWSMMNSRFETLNSRFEIDLRGQQLEFDSRIIDLKREYGTNEDNLRSVINELRLQLSKSSTSVVSRDSIRNTIVVDQKTNEELISKYRNQISKISPDQSTSRRLLELDIERLTKENLRLSTTMKMMESFISEGKRVKPIENPTSDLSKVIVHDSSGIVESSPTELPGYVFLSRPSRDGGPFYISKHLVTQREYSAFISETNKLYGQSETNRGNREIEKPVLGITWDEAKDFCDWKSRKDEKNYRLPMVAEWKFAAKNNHEFRAELSPKIWEWCNDVLDLENKKASIIKIHNTGSNTIDAEEAYRNVRIGDLSFRIVIDTLKGMATK